MSPDNGPNTAGSISGSKLVDNMTQGSTSLGGGISPAAVQRARHQTIVEQHKDLLKGNTPFGGVKPTQENYEIWRAVWNA